jgi:hypothetical protein
VDFYRLRPEVAGGLGPNSVLDTAGIASSEVEPFHGGE